MLICNSTICHLIKMQKRKRVVQRIFVVCDFLYNPLRTTYQLPGIQKKGSMWLFRSNLYWKSFFLNFKFWNIFWSTIDIPPPQVACAKSCEKSTFITFLNIAFMSGLLLSCASHYVYVSCLIVKPDVTCVSCQLHNSSFARHNELKFCPRLKKLSTNTTRK